MDILAAFGNALGGMVEGAQVGGARIGQLQTDTEAGVIAAGERAQKRKIEDLTLQREGERLDLAKTESGVRTDAARLALDEQRKTQEVRLKIPQLELETAELKKNIAKLQFDADNATDTGIKARAKLQLDAANTELAIKNQELEVSKMKSWTPQQNFEWRNKEYLDKVAKTDPAQAQEIKNLYQRFNTQGEVREAANNLVTVGNLRAATVAARASSATSADGSTKQKDPSVMMENYMKSIETATKIANDPLSTPEMKDMMKDQIVRIKSLSDRIDVSDPGSPQENKYGSELSTVLDEADRLFRDTKAAKRGTGALILGLPLEIGNDYPLSKKLSSARESALRLSEETKKKLSAPIEATPLQNVDNFDSYLKLTRSDDQKELDAREKEIRKLLVGHTAKNVDRIVAEERDIVRKKQMKIRNKEWETEEGLRAWEEDSARARVENARPTDWSLMGAVKGTGKTVRNAASLLRRMP